MALFRHTQDLPAEARGGVVAIGNFDGVHRGHRAVLAEAQARARELGTHASVLTFEPHPYQLFKPDAPPFRLATLRTKVRFLEACELAHLFVLPFDWDLAGYSPEAFVADILVRNLSARHVVVGEGFRFGRKRAGDVELLRREGDAHGFGVSAMPPVSDADGRVISSSRIRDALRAGEVAEATALLGRPWEIEGRVQHGDKRGRTIGFPTANIALGEMLEPAHGIYAVRAGIDAGPETEWWDGAAYVGRRPTVTEGTPGVLFETHLLDVSPDLYGQHLRVRVHAFVRGDWAFDGLDALKQQIARDCESARAALPPR
ncbi:FMN adenylyltransferase /riboflavin kinase [Limimonas halophila]|uniref:Riboflavin biosynthesis protein n=1 Tax=Limimonas halophila TaxID=1082479 RepID=A0A1G7SUJ7_9PROT|nr:bifunctional riboflavin kinase/FAD synthetase [Limimonas halophila]SDG26109.1 FMN adenylyltransferase /riboflavin kinase [Limimonas halophila]